MNSVTHWPSRLAALLRRRPAAAAVAVVLVVAIAVTIGVTVGSSSDSTAEPAPTATSGAEGEGVDADAPQDAEPSASAAPMTAAETQRYCRAWRGLEDVTASPVEDDASVDLARLARTFEALETGYAKAQAVAPPELVSDYATVVGYLAAARDTVRARDVDQLKILVTNLTALDRFMNRITKESAVLCA